MLEYDGDLIKTGDAGEQLARKHGVVGDIHREDYIFLSLYRTYGEDLGQGLSFYFDGGRSSAEKFQGILQNLRANANYGRGLASPRLNILDFASGYGCVARHFKNLLPDDHIVTMDVHEQACTFNQQHLGLEGRLSSFVPSLLPASPDFHVVFALSFFSHMPRKNVGKWLRKLSEFVQPDGFLIFTAHGARTHTQHLKDLAVDDAGYGFIATSEQYDLSVKEYGHAITYPFFMFDVLRGLREWEIIDFKEGVWWEHQDLYVLRKRPVSRLRRAISRLTGRPLDVETSGEPVETDAAASPDPDDSISAADAQKLVERYGRGIAGDIPAWIEFNRAEALATSTGRALIAPFPPAHLMRDTSGLERPADFAVHGALILSALVEASPVPVNTFQSVLDFGVGVGRLARMFKGFKGTYHGVDVDARNIAWVSAALPYVKATASAPSRPLPYADNSFDAIISISVFTHMTEADQIYYLGELRRVAKPGALLLLTVSGERVVRRALEEAEIFKMMATTQVDLLAAVSSFEHGAGFHFVPQTGHLTTDSYTYGMTFISERYIRGVWSKYFDLVEIRSGAIADFQDIVVLRKR